MRIARLVNKAHKLEGLDRDFMFAQKKCFEIDAHLKPVLETAGIPWRGYHGFRRGNATYLAKHQGSHGATLLLRHSNVSKTETHYIKNSAQDRRAAEAKKQVEISAEREQAAATLGAGLSAARKQAN